MVVGAVIWGKPDRKSATEASSAEANGNDVAHPMTQRRVSRVLCFAALAWLASIVVLLIFMTTISISHQALLETLAGILVLGLTALAYFWLRHHSESQTPLQPAKEE
jgi:uncharacterized membrane protein